MKIFLATLSLLAAFTINAFAQMADKGINPNTVSPPIPGAPPAIPNKFPPLPLLNTTNTTRVDQSSRSCNNLTGQELISCRQNYKNSLHQ